MPRQTPSINYTFKTAPQKSGYVLVNDNKEAANFTAFLAKSNTALVPSARFLVKDASVDLSLTNSQGKSGFKKANDIITWESIFPSTDIKYQIKADGLSQDVVIKDASFAAKAIKGRERYTISLFLNTKNVVPRRDIDGNLTPIFMDSKTKEYRFHLETPLIIDGKGQIFPLSLAELKPSTDGTYELNLELPREWMTDVKRLYPVRVTSGIFYNRETAFNE